MARTTDLGGSAPAPVIDRTMLLCEAGGAPLAVPLELATRWVTCTIEPLLLSAPWVRGVVVEEGTLFVAVGDPSRPPSSKATRETTGIVLAMPGAWILEVDRVLGIARLEGVRSARTGLTGEARTAAGETVACLDRGALERLLALGTAERRS